MAVIGTSVSAIVSSAGPASPVVLATPSQSSALATAGLLELAALLPNPTIVHPDVAGQVKVDLSGLGSLAVELSSARQAQLEAIVNGQRGRARDAHLAVVQREVRLELAGAITQVRSAKVALGRANEDLADFALGTFVGSSALELEFFSTDTGPSPIPTLAGDAEAVLVGAMRSATRGLAEAEERRDRLSADLDSTARERVRVGAAIDRADAEREAAAEEVSRLEPAFESALLTAPVVGAEFPVVVLDAYYRAALRTAETKPWCEVRWDQLAGIGKVESGHGTFGGTSVGRDGRTDGEILGPVLDGSRFASIPDTDGGRHDLDPVWDRAVGPMQFIPGSWARYGADGNGDGEVDPHNMYDAALAAAHHLCGTTGGLADEVNYQRALLGYNRSAPYGLMVMGFASRYRSAVDLLPTPTSVADPVVEPLVAALRSSVVD